MENNMTFEQALARLEKIVRELESGEVALEESIKLFEEGVKLSGVCSSLLKQAKQKVEILIDNGNEIQKEDFKVNE